MKKVLAFIALVALASLPALAVTITNSIGQVFTVTTAADGSIVTTVLSAGTQPAAATNAVSGPPNVMLAQKGEATTTSNHTPKKPGDLLIGELTGNTNAVWIATGTTASSWKKITND